VPRARAAEPGVASAPAMPSPPPWDDAPPADAPFDDGAPFFAEDAYFAAERFDDARADVRDAGQAASQATPAIDLSTLPPPVMLDALGYTADWPTLAAELSLKGVAHQLAFNSELTMLEGKTLKLVVPVPQYAESAHVAKLKAALDERLGSAVDVRVEVGPARRTAAAIEAAARAQRQREAEQEIGADPFVRSLIRDFGASIVPGSVRPITPDAGASAH
jgi:DNA polymerase-3 subunit gamma/tau